jgi:hypothetical protein
VEVFRDYQNTDKINEIGQSVQRQTAITRPLEMSEVQPQKENPVRYDKDKVLSLLC